MKLSIYRLPDDTGPRYYDIAAAAACLQGLVNRTEGPCVYITGGDGRAGYWLEKFTQAGEWLSGRELTRLGHPTATKA